MEANVHGNIKRGGGWGNVLIKPHPTLVLLYEIRQVSSDPGESYWDGRNQVHFCYQKNAKWFLAWFWLKSKQKDMSNRGWYLSNKAMQKERKKERRKLGEGEMGKKNNQTKLWQLLPDPKDVNHIYCQLSLETENPACSILVLPWEKFNCSVHLLLFSCLLLIKPEYDPLSTLVPNSDNI